MENGSQTAICWWYSGTPIGGACTNSVGYHLSVHCYWTRVAMALESMALAGLLGLLFLTKKSTP